jgi:ribonuclease HI
MGTTRRIVHTANEAVAAISWFRALIWNPKMSVPRPHFLLFCDGTMPAAASANGASTLTNQHRGRWRFVLESLENSRRLEAADAEVVDTPDRLALLAVVRGLEALEQPSHVTLVTSSRYVSRGLQYGLNEWREQHYCWEHFGVLQPIRNQDLWQRVDHALQYHEVTCRFMATETTTSIEAHEPLNEIVHHEANRPEMAVATTVSVQKKSIDEKLNEALAGNQADDGSAQLKTSDTERLDGPQLQLAAATGKSWRRVDAAHESFAPASNTAVPSQPLMMRRPRFPANEASDAPPKPWTPERRQRGVPQNRVSSFWDRLSVAIQVLQGKNALVGNGQIVS